MTSIILSYIRSEPINSIEKRMKRLTIAKGFWISCSNVRNKQLNVTPMKSSGLRDTSRNILSSTPNGESTDDSGTSYREDCDEEDHFVKYFPMQTECEHIQSFFADYDRKVKQSKRSFIQAPKMIEYNVEADDDSSISTLGSVVSDALQHASRPKVSSYSPMAVGSF